MPAPAPCPSGTGAGGSSSGAAVSVATGAAFIGLGSGHGRLHSHSGRTQRHCGLQKHRTAGADDRRRAAIDHAGHRLRPDPQRARCHRGTKSWLHGASRAARRRWRHGAWPYPRTPFWRDWTPGRADLRTQPGHLAPRRCPHRAPGAAEVTDLASIQATGGFSAAEKLCLAPPWLAQHADRYDPRVRTRIERGGRHDCV